MFWKLLRLIGILVVLLCFIGFNLDNQCDISFGFAALRSVPVFFTVLASFVLGLLCAVPFAVSFHRGRSRKTDPQAAGLGEHNPYGID
ncbi:MAG: hypothetical protein LBD37_08850 [Treponema sp.]|jgi:uncharacterized integral membrane protein|nr:hypothetical protein [Treponema sp.]